MLAKLLKAQSHLTATIMAALVVFQEQIDEVVAHLESTPTFDELPVFDDELPDDLPHHARFPAPFFKDHLCWDSNVSDTSPVVKGTWVTVHHIVQMIVEGWTWSDVLRTHPELTEDDLRAALAFTVAADHADCPHAIL